MANCIGNLIAERKLRKSYRVHWFDAWNSTLDHALATLPEMNGCSHELYRLLALNPDTKRKRTVLVTKSDTPVCVATVFQRANDWAPVTNYLTPGSLFPVDPNCIHHVPALIGVNLTLAGWHLPLPAQEFLDARSLAFRPTFKMDCSQDIERYWQQQGQLRAIKRSRKRCTSFRIEVNAPESLDWTIKNWHSKYKESRLGDRLLVARYLHDQGKMYTISAKDDEKLIAAEALLVYRDELIFQYNYRDPQYDWYGIGNRLLDHCFQWASEMGFKKLDLGGFSPEYKKRWAPQDGEIWVARICPELAHLKEVVRGWPPALRSLLGPTTNERASSK